MTGQKPIKTIKAGSVSSAIFENEMSVNGKNITVLKTTLQRRYKTKDGSWKSSNSFNRNEIALAIYCLLKSFEAMIGEANGDSDSGE